MKTVQLECLNGGSQPLWVQEVPAKVEQLAWQKRGLTYTATGYGARIPTTVMVQHRGRWRRVYCRIYSNSGTCFIGKWSDGIRVSETYL